MSNTDLALSWTVLGAGTAAPHAHRTPSGHLLQTPSTTLLVDMGPGTLWRLAAAGVDWANLDAIVLSHAHLDHTLDLAALMFAANLPGHGRTRPLPIVASPACKAVMDRLGAALERWFVPRGFDVPWILVEQGAVQLGDVSLELAPVVHHPSSLGMRFEAAGRSIAYSGDSDRCDALVHLARVADLAVLECSTDVGRKVGGHMTPVEVAAVAEEARAGAVALVHMVPELDGVDLEAAVRHHGFRGPVKRCPDGARFGFTASTPTAT